MLPEFQNINEEDIKLNDKLNDKALKTKAKVMNDSIDEATARARLIVRQCRALRATTKASEHALSHLKTAKAHIEEMKKSQDIMIKMHWDMLQVIGQLDLGIAAARQTQVPQLRQGPRPLQEEAEGLQQGPAPLQP